MNHNHDNREEEDMLRELAGYVERLSTRERFRGETDEARSQRLKIVSTAAAFMLVNRCTCPACRAAVSKLGVQLEGFRDSWRAARAEAGHGKKA